MPDASSQIIAEKVAETRDALLRHSDAVDAKAGVLLGAAGAFVALAFTSFSWWRAPGIACAVAAGLGALLVFLPDRYPTLELRRLRERYLAAEPVFTRRQVMDTEIVVIERHSIVLRRNARRLRFAVAMFALATVLLTGGSLVQQIGG